MKTSTLPSIRVEPALRSTVESLLAEGESLSQFVETAIRHSVQQRQQQHTFIERGLASLAAAEQSQDYVSADHVLSDLRTRLTKARTKVKLPRA
jgi:predicted transcriptional regulator